jgi:hypothetical protein
MMRDAQRLLRDTLGIVWLLVGMVVLPILGSYMDRLPRTIDLAGNRQALVEPET